MLGSGSFSKVYKGSYRKQACAIKIIFTLDLTEEIINRIAAEAHILSQIKHPNVIHIYGVSVLPPSVCIVLELCAFGSLANILQGSGVISSAEDKETRSFSQLVISQTDRYFLALGCARGLAALHAHSESLVHRDVKSFNFLVDGQFNVKIADLELGTMPLLPNAYPSNPSPAASSSSSNNKARFSLTSQPGNDDGDEQGPLSLGSSIDLESRGSIAYLGLKKNEILPNWAAPEVLQSGVHVKASDVYSLALVLW
jgi:serine/threonine protein kinase